MVISGRARVTLTNSKLVSHISTDISRIDLLVLGPLASAEISLTLLFLLSFSSCSCGSFFHFSYSALIALAEVSHSGSLSAQCLLLNARQVIIILLCTIGVSSLAGVAVVAIAIPAQTFAMKRLYRGRQKSMVFTDSRIKTISEIRTSWLARSGHLTFA